MLLAAVLCGALQAAPAAAPTPGAPGFPPSLKPGCLAADGQRDLWCPGDNGYGCYKIPSLLRVPFSDTAVLLAFVEARKHSCDDGGYIDLWLRRSEDDGRTWLEPQMVWGNSTEKEWHTIGDALPLYDAVTGKVNLIFCKDNDRVYHTQSADYGKTWATPRDITTTAKHVVQGGFVGMGHPNGIQLSTGRLVAPAYGGGLNSYALVSDDHGETWSIAGTIDGGGEWTVAELAPGTGHLFGSLRSSAGSRLQTYSLDGGSSWSNSTHQKQLPEPIQGCEASVVAHPNGKLYYSHPDNRILRDRMNIKVSADNGTTWSQHVTIWGPGAGCDHPCVPAAGYSAMQVMGTAENSSIGIFYGRNNETMAIFEARGMSFTTFAP